MLFSKKIISLSLLLFMLLTSLYAENISSLSMNNNVCYKTRTLVFGLEDVFEALKKTLLQGNLNIVTVTKKDGVLTAKGTQYNEDEDTATDITMSISFKEVGLNETHVISIASYNTREIKSEFHQLGAAGISLPIPVPLTGRYVNTGSGNINDSAWYQGFYNSVSLSLFENRMKYSKTEVLKIEEKKVEAKEEIQTNTEKEIEKIEETKKNIQTQKEEKKVQLDTNPLNIE